MTAGIKLVTGTIGVNFFFTARTGGAPHRPPLDIPAKPPHGSPFQVPANLVSVTSARCV
jgi:hypothetical protein